MIEKSISSQLKKKKNCSMKRRDDVWWFRNQKKTENDDFQMKEPMNREKYYSENFKSAHMFINLKFNWTNNHKINRIYLVDIKNQKFIDEIFDKLHKQKKNWMNE